MKPSLAEALVRFVAGFDRQGATLGAARQLLFRLGD